MSEATVLVDVFCFCSFVVPLNMLAFMRILGAQYMFQRD